MKHLQYSVLAIGLALLTANGLGGRALGQDTAKDDMRYQVTAAISKFTDAANRADTATVMKMFSTKPEVCVIGDGEVFQGTDDIRSHAERLLGQRDKYLLQLGTMSIKDVHGVALAIGPYTLRPRAGDHALALRGTVTFVMEKEGRRGWFIAHIHRSTVAVNSQVD